MEPEYWYKVSVWRKKPINISAMKWNGHNFTDIAMFAGENVYLDDGDLVIKTLEDGKDGKAKHVANIGDFIIRGVRGEFYFCKPDIFLETYEIVEQ